MIAFDPQTTSVILAACSGLALGVAGMRAVDATADWRMMARHRRHSRRLVRELAAAGVAAAPSDLWTWTVPRLTRPGRVSASAGAPATPLPRVRPAPEGVRGNRPVATQSPADRPPPLPASVRTAERPKTLGFNTLPGLTASVCHVPETMTARVHGSPETPPPLPQAALPAWQAMTAPVSDAPYYPAPHLQMRAIDHVVEFVAHQRDGALGKNPVSGRWECRRATADVLAAYRQWAKARALVMIPEWQFLNLLASQPGVEKSRDRLKDANGRVPRTEGGSPVRTYYYTIVELPPQRAEVRLRRTG